MTTTLALIALLLTASLQPPAKPEPGRNVPDNTAPPKAVPAQAPVVSAHDARMAWWRDARFGMFIHWGLYAIPAGKWGEETNHAEWIRTTAKIPLAEYDKLVGQFNPVKFN